MDRNFADLCYACRVGDTDNADRLISTGINLNDVDQFDNSPLFLASLCGHEEVVKLLLTRGAVCDRDRYEGARCIYGALTDSIRDILLRHDISKSVDVNQPFTMHISSLIKNDSLFDTHDLCFGMTERIRLHRFILILRSTYFKQELMANRQMKHSIELPEDISKDELQIIIKFIYLIPVLHEISPKQYPSLINFSRKWNISVLADFLDKVSHTLDPSEKSVLMANFQYQFIEIARNQLCSFVNDNILRNVMELELLDEAQVVEMNHLNADLVFPDLLLFVQDFERKKRYAIPCHLSILSRAYYFKLMFSLPFVEKVSFSSNHNCQNFHNFDTPTVISLPPCGLDVAIIILKYLYYDNSEISWEYAIDVLLVADMLLEDRLKSMAAVVVTQSKEILLHYSIFDILYVAWETRMERLEHFVARVIAQDIQLYANDPELKQAIMQSSQRISAREETDTIELVDDIRFYLLKKYAFELDDIEFLSNEQDSGVIKSSGILDYQKDIAVVEELLTTLLLQA